MKRSKLHALIGAIDRERRPEFTTFSELTIDFVARQVVYKGRVVNATSDTLVIPVLESTHLIVLREQGVVL